jgi:hypothetical protein
MANDWHARHQGEEPQRAMGQIWDLRQGEEPQRAMGQPIDSVGPSAADREWLFSLLHPVRTYKRWVRRRRMGPYAPDEDEP